MKTSIMEVRDMLSVLSVPGVEKRIGEVPGVESVTVNYAAGNTTVRYDETRLNIAEIKSGVRQGGYESDATPASNGHEGHPPPGTPSAPTASPAPKSASDSAASAAPGGGLQKDKGSPGLAASIKATVTPKPAPAATTQSPKSSPDAAAASVVPAGDGKKEKADTDKS